MVTHLRLIEDKQPLTFTGIPACVAGWLAVTSLPTLWNADRKPTVWCGWTLHQDQPWHQIYFNKSHSKHPSSPYHHGCHGSCHTYSQLSLCEQTHTQWHLVTPYFLQICFL